MDLEPDTNYLKAKANLEEPERAVRLYDSVLKKNPLHAGAWLGKGNSLVLLNRYEEAIECFDQAIELSVGRPREREAWFGKGDALCQLGRFEQGIQCFNKALDIDPAYVTAWRRKGGWLAYMGEYRQALTCLYKVLEIAPDHPEEVRLAREIITLIT
jgi:tetratricopeptide (TPR) repeat protein